MKRIALALLLPLMTSCGPATEPAAPAPPASAPVTAKTAPEAAPPKAPPASSADALSRAKAELAKLKVERNCPQKAAAKEAPKTARVNENRIEISQVIEFEKDSSELKASSDPALESVVAALSDASIERVEIAGHADASGSDAKNLALTGQRASSVRAWLVSQGIKEERLSTAGYGSYCPVDTATTEAAKAKNRRVEFVITRRGGKEVAPGWGGCAEAEKKGLKPASKGATKPGAPSKTAAIPWKPGMTIPDTICGTSLAPAALPAGGPFSPRHRTLGLTSGTASDKAEAHLAAALGGLCEAENDAEELFRRQRRAFSSLVYYGNTRSGDAERKDALARAKSVAEQLKTNPRSSNIWDCQDIAWFEFMTGDPAALDRATECKNAVNLPLQGWTLLLFSLQAHDVLRGKPEHGDRLQKLDTLAIKASLGRQDHTARFHAVHALYLAGKGKTEASYEQWAEAIKATCDLPSERWLFDLGPEEIFK